MKLMRGSIQEMYDNFKRLITDDSFFFALLIILVALTSFGLGRWSVAQNKPNTPVLTPTTVVREPQAAVAGIEVKNVPPPSTKNEELGAVGKMQYVASKSGTKYHLLWCPGAKTIKESNKVYFSSKEEAESAGYQPAANCKGI
jgi:hypothetical protein